MSTIPTLIFQGNCFQTAEALVNAMGMDWNPGKKLLFSGELRQRLTKKHTLDDETEPETDGLSDFVKSCTWAENACTEKPKAGNAIYLRWLCMQPGIHGLYWQGRNFGGLKDLGKALQDEPDPLLSRLILHMLRSQYLSQFLDRLGGSEELRDHVRYLEKQTGRAGARFRPENALSMLAVFLNGCRTFSFHDHIFRKAADLAAYLQPFADESKAALSAVIQPLFQDSDHFAPAFEAWIMMQGYHHELTLWKGRFQESAELVSEPDMEDDLSDMPDEAEEALEEQEEGRETVSMTDGV